MIFVFEHAESVSVAKEIRDVNQQIFQQRLNLLRIFAQKYARYEGMSSRFVNLQMARDAANQGRRFVMRKIVSGANSQ